jgi:hypothetical protein
MNICLHQGEKTEPDPGVPWRCEHCTHVLGHVIEGVCIANHQIKLSEGPTVVVCPVCHNEQRWYSDFDRKMNHLLT